MSWIYSYWPTPQAQQRRIRATSATYTTARGNARPQPTEVPTLFTNLNTLFSKPELPRVIIGPTTPGIFLIITVSINAKEGSGGNKPWESEDGSHFKLRQGRILLPLGLSFSACTVSSLQRARQPIHVQPKVKPRVTGHFSRGAVSSQSQD